MVFLDVPRDQALKTKVLMSGYEQSSDISGACHKCGKLGHRAKMSTEAKSNNVYTSSTDSSKTKEDKKESQRALREMSTL